MGPFYLGLPYLATAIVCVAISLGLLWINPGRLINQILILTASFVSASFCCIFAIHIAGSDDPIRHNSALVFWLRMNGVTHAFVPWSLWLVKEAILDEGDSLRSLLKRSWLLAVLSVFLATICLTDSYIPPNSDPQDKLRGVGYVFFASAIYLSIGTIMFGAFRALKKITGVRRIEMQYFLLNACTAGLLIVVVSVLRRIYNVPGLTYIPSITVLFCMGMMVWAVSHHRVFDARQFMATLGHRVAMLIVLLIGTSGIAIPTSSVIGLKAGVVLGVTLSGISMFLIDRRVKNWLGLNFEQIVSEQRRKIIACARRESDPEVICGRFEDLLADWCQTTCVEVITEPAVMAHQSERWIGESTASKFYRDGWLTPERLQRFRPDDGILKALKTVKHHKIGALIWTPRGADQPSLLIKLGYKHSGRPYTYPDIAILMNLAELMDNILTHASLAQHAAKLAQMESAAMMSRSLSHDLRNLTTPIAAYLLCTEGRARPGSPEAEVYDAARHSMKVMDDYIRESLFFSRRLVPEFTEVDPRDAMVSVIKLAHDRAAKRGIALSLDCPQEIRFSVDYALFERLMLNLVHNAIDASGYGGMVRVSSGRRFEKIYLRVEDQGEGIAPENLRRIFDPYFTTKDTGDTRRGLGLGLAICRKIVDLHGGDLEVESTPGRGAVFTALFPVRQPLKGAKRPQDVSGVRSPASFAETGLVSPSLDAAGTSA